MRLYEISYNKEQWSVKGSRDSGYKLVNRATLDSYSINGDVIGIEQISDDTFLVYRRIMRDKWQISRLKFEANKVEILYHKEFQHFVFLTEDLILFDKNYHVLGAHLYSISNNSESDSLNHLLGSDPDCQLIQGREIRLFYQHKVDEYPTHLLVEYHFSSYPLDIGAYLQVILDPKTLTPISPVYSTLRDKYFSLNDSLTLGQIAKEDADYAGVIGSFLSTFYSEDKRKSFDDLLSMTKQE